MNDQKIAAYPLCWPIGRPRSKVASHSKFKTSFAKARDALIREVELLGGKDLIISANLMVGRDGFPLANKKAPQDAGVAVYFKYKKRQMCFACDRWYYIAENMQAIAKTIEALRGIERWGSGDMMEAAFTGFVALPSQKKTWYEILGVDKNISFSEVERVYKELRSKHHPDKGGNHERFIEIQQAWEQAKTTLA